MEQGHPYTKYYARVTRAALSFLHVFLHAPIEGIGHIEVVSFAECNKVRLAELSEALSWLTGHAKDFARRIELDYLPGMSIRKYTLPSRLICKPHGVPK